MWWWKRRRKVARVDELHPDTRLPDGDTVVRPGQATWTALYRSERAGTSDRPLMTRGAENRASTIRRRHEV